MAERTASSWMSRQGRHSVTIGSTLQRTLKARKNEPPPNAKHQRHYYAFRYQFMPESVDLAKPGTAQVRKGEEHKKVDLQRGSVNSDDEVHLFHGTETPAKEWDCVLIYDEDSKMFTLEKLDSGVRFVYDKKHPRSQLQTGSPLPSSIPSTSASSPDSASLAQSGPKRTKPRTAVEQLEIELEGELMQDSPRTSQPKAAAPEPARKPPQKKDPRDLMFRKKVQPPKVPVPPPRKEEEEESEGEIVEHPKGNTSSRPSATPVSAAASPTLAAGQAKKKTLAEGLAAIRAKPATPALKPPTPPTHPLPPKPTAVPASQKLIPPPAVMPPQKPTPTPTPTPTVAPPQKLSPAPPAIKKATKPIPTKKRERPDELAAQPSPPKRSRPSPPPPTRPPPPPPPKKKEVDLALPGSSDFALPSSSAPPSKPSKLNKPSKPSKPSKLPGSKPSSSSLAFPGSSDVAPSLPLALPLSVPAPEADDSDEEDWLNVLPTIQTSSSSVAAAVPTPAPAPLPMAPRAITMEEIVPEPTVRHEEPDEEEEEIDEDMFAEELNQHLGEDEEEDFLAAQISPVVESQPMPAEDRRPMSMNQFAGGLGEDDENDNMWGDDDDTSSSDDSDDD